MKKKSVSISAELYDSIEKRLPGTDFHSVDEYVGFVLAEVLKDDEPEEPKTYSKEEEAEVKKRLKALGYME